MCCPPSRPSWTGQDWGSPGVRPTPDTEGSSELAQPLLGRLLTWHKAAAQRPRAWLKCHPQHIAEPKSRGARGGACTPSRRRRPTPPITILYQVPAKPCPP
ncbi:hypothetical protein KIL84_022337 [Mauremys mutica]|uniref:Uncharacterized protein n=1 Tax=Mauremys mutica TaxID=74926 RepID=A0A9D4ATM2_9SAUR|nr:hypothetical protein KIL84_022337 [Mauremys mutica]